MTMPSEAAGHFGLFRDLVVNRMDCMLVNCAHDGPSEWPGMLSNLEHARLEIGLECHVLMDLGDRRHELL